MARRNGEMDKAEAGFVGTRGDGEAATDFEVWPNTSEGGKLRDGCKPVVVTAESSPMSPSKEKPAYRTALYEVSSFQQAKLHTVTAEEGITSEERWERETPWLCREIVKHLGINSEMCVLDYGCGTGRLSKALIEATGCRVIGVDFSNSLRLVAADHVLSERFNVWSIYGLAQMIEKGFRVDRAICCWVLQHAYDLPAAIALIHRALKPGAGLYVINSHTRCVPVEPDGYFDDGLDVAAELQKSFELVTVGALPVEVATPAIVAHAFTAVLRKR
jgi:SAM-dependent methyltransferase